jgi:hypothetical protein
VVEINRPVAYGMQANHHIDRCAPEYLVQPPLGWFIIVQEALEPVTGVEELITEGFLGFHFVDGGLALSCEDGQQLRESGSKVVGRFRVCKGVYVVERVLRDVAFPQLEC